MREPQKNEVAALDAGLRNVEGGLDFIPVEVEATLKDLGLDELHRLFRVGCSMACVLMAQKGWVLMMIKRKVGFGNFKDHLRAQRFDYTYATMCMNVARAIAKHPALANIGDVKVLRRIAYLPDQTQAEIEVELNVPENVFENGKLVKRNRHWKDLRPWVLLRIASDLREQAKKPRKKLTVDPDLGKDEMADKPWMDLCKLFNKAVGAMNLLADAADNLEMRPEYFDRIFERNMLRALMAPGDKLIRKWHPIEEVEKRAEIIHAPGIGKGRKH